MSLDNYTTEELVNEIRRRTEIKTIELSNHRDKLAFKCRTCGEIEYAGSGNFFADRRPFGVIWHYKCTHISNRNKVGLMDHLQGTFNGTII